MIHLKCGKKNITVCIKNILLGRNESNIETFSNKKKVQNSSSVVTPLQEMMIRIHQTETKGY